MRLLTHIEDDGGVIELTDLLHRKGIPTYVKKGRWGRSQQFNDGIYVCIDAHYDDAVALMHDPEHEVAEPVDVDAFDADARSFEGPLLRWAFLALLVVAGLFVIIVRASI